MNRTALSFVVIASSVAATWLAFSPVLRGLSKIGGEPWRLAQWVFWHESLPSLAAGIVLAGLGAHLAEKRTLLGLVLLIIAPIAAFTTGLFL